MKIHSVNVGKVETHVWQGKSVETGIFKYPVEGVLPIAKMNVEGDSQADLKHHGGVDKAVYAYAREHYMYWEKALNKTLEYGVFGENLTTGGLLDESVSVGDQFKMGSTILMAIQPRIPCYKLSLRFNDTQMTKRFMEAQKFGIYFRVIKEGEIQKGSSILLIEKATTNLSIQDVVDCFVSKNKDQDQLKKIIEEPLIPEALTDYFSRFVK